MLGVHRFHLASRDGDAGAVPRPVGAVSSPRRRWTFVEFLIQQRGCQEITMIRKRGYLGKTTTERHQVKIDGHFHIDSPWFGGREKIAISASFIGQLLEIIATPPRDSTSIYWKTRYELLPNKDLSIAEFQETTQTYGPALVAQRQR